MGQTALFGMFDIDGTCYRPLEEINSKNPVNFFMSSWVFCQVILFYTNFLSQVYFMIQAKISGFLTLREKCNVSDMRK
jgi:hypothetical protein